MSFTIEGEHTAHLLQKAAQRSGKTQRIVLETAVENFLNDLDTTNSNRAKQIDKVLLDIDEVLGDNHSS